MMLLPGLHQVAKHESCAIRPFHFSVTHLGGDVFVECTTSMLAQHCLLKHHWAPESHSTGQPLGFSHYLQPWH